jgi:hypothetical protein
MLFALALGLGFAPDPGGTKRLERCGEFEPRTSQTESKLSLPVPRCREPVLLGLKPAIYYNQLGLSRGDGVGAILIAVDIDFAILAPVRPPSGHLGRSSPLTVRVISHLAYSCKEGRDVPDSFGYAHGPDRWY